MGCLVRSGDVSFRRERPEGYPKVTQNGKLSVLGLDDDHTYIINSFITTQIVCMLFIYHTEYIN